MAPLAMVMQAALAAAVDILTFHRVPEAVAKPAPLVKAITAAAAAGHLRTERVAVVVQAPAAALVMEDLVAPAWRRRLAAPVPPMQEAEEAVTNLPLRALADREVAGRALGALQVALTALTALMVLVAVVAADQTSAGSLEKAAPAS